MAETISVKEYQKLSKKKNKYNATVVIDEGKRFASKAEHRRWKELVLQEKAGEISNLKFQVRYKLNLNGVFLCSYVADFTYNDSTGAEVVEDCKGVETGVFRLKKKLMKAIYGIDIFLSKA